MDEKLVREFVQCEAQRRMTFPYFSGRYALLLLKYLIGDGRSIAELRRSDYRSLLEKPISKTLLAHAGNGQLTPQLLNLAWSEPAFHFVITIDAFDGWTQTSRNGANLVIQLNFANDHQSAYRHLMRPLSFGLFQGGAHPTCRSGLETLAWVRVDLDLDREEALIEEVQSDWIRLVDSFVRNCRRCGRVCCYHRKQLRTTMARLERYQESLKPYRKIWAEAALAAAVDYLAELGIRHIYCHEYETGCRLKNIDPEWGPPRSLYTELPKRFCMQRVRQGPDFLIRQRGVRRRLSKIKAPAFFLLDLAAFDSRSSA